jgi:hypothetical protein
MRNVLVFGSLAIAAIAWTGVAAQQETQPRPGPGSGVTRVSGNVSVSGTVSVDALPDVNAKQRGQWRVGVTDLPDIRVAAPAFVRKGGRYRITWTNGDEETVTVASQGSDGWIQVEAGARWLNLRNARVVDPLN